MDWNVEEQAAKGPGMTVPNADPVCERHCGSWDHRYPLQLFCKMEVSTPTLHLPECV